jgi:signal peptidase II
MLPAIYNVADIAIVVSMGLFILLTILGVGIDGTRARSSDDGSEGAGGDDVVSPLPDRDDPAA